MVNTTTIRFIKLGYGGGEGWLWVCLSCGERYCSCCNDRCPKCGSTKVHFTDQSVGNDEKLIGELNEVWFKKLKEPWNACIGPIDAECPDQDIVKEGKWKDWAICRNWAVLNDGICPEDDHDENIEEEIG